MPKTNFLRKMRCDTLMFFEVAENGFMYTNVWFLFSFPSEVSVSTKKNPQKKLRNKQNTDQHLRRFFPDQFLESHRNKIGSSRTEASRYLDRTALCRTSSFVLPSLSLSFGYEHTLSFCFSLLFPSFALVSRCIPFCFTLHSLRCEKNVF